MRREATPDEIAKCVRDAPDTALTFAAEELNDEQLAACAKRCPSSAILFAWNRLTPEQRENCVRRAPAMALMAIPHELTPEQFRLCKIRAPRAASEFTAQYYDPDRNTSDLPQVININKLQLSAKSGLGCESSNTRR